MIFEYSIWDTQFLHRHECIFFKDANLIILKALDGEYASVDHVFVAVLVDLVLLILLVLVLLVLPGSLCGRGVGSVVGASSSPLRSQVLKHRVGVLRQHALLKIRKDKYYSNLSCLNCL